MFFYEKCRRVISALLLVEHIPYFVKSLFCSFCDTKHLRWEASMKVSYKTVP